MKIKKGYRVSIFDGENKRIMSNSDYDIKGIYKLINRLYKSLKSEELTRLCLLPNYKTIRLNLLTNFVDFQNFYNHLTISILDESERLQSDERKKRKYNRYRTLRKYDYIKNNCLNKFKILEYKGNENTPKKVKIITQEYINYINLQAEIKQAKEKLREEREIKRILREEEREIKRILREEKKTKNPKPTDEEKRNKKIMQAFKKFKKWIDKKTKARDKAIKAMNQNTAKHTAKTYNSKSQILFRQAKSQKVKA